MNKPPKGSQELMKDGLSNGIIMWTGKRTLNFETGEFPEYYNDLIPDSA